MATDAGMGDRDTREIVVDTVLKLPGRQGHVARREDVNSDKGKRSSLELDGEE